MGGDSQKGAISHIIAYRLSNLDYFKTPDMVFEVLRGVYEDKNLKNNSRRIYIGLKQRSTDSFAMFFFEFRKLSSILRYIDEMLIENLKNKVLPRLRDALINQQVQYTSLAAMKDYLQGLNDDQRAFLADQDRRARLAAVRNTHAPAAAPAASTYASKVYAAPSAVTVLPRPAALAAVPAEAGSSLATIQCHRCKRLDHYMRDCSKPAPADVHEIEEYEIDSENA